MEHTPIPWRVKNNTSVYGPVPKVAGGMESIVADCAPVRNTVRKPEEQQANAEFITRVCNVHYQLLQACEQALEAFDNDAHRGDKYFNGENAAIARLKLAIAKAKGQS